MKKHYMGLKDMLVKFVIMLQPGEEVFSYIKSLSMTGNDIIAMSVTLIKHQKSIHEGCIFQCGQCDKQFSQKGAIRTHQQEIHQGKKNVCKVCGFEGKRSAVEYHNHLMHVGKIYQCNLCEYSAVRNYDLLKHKKVVHVQNKV